MDGPPILKLDFRIRAYEVDMRGNLSFLSVCNFLQEAAGRHADMLGVSIHRLMAENRTWVLSRLGVEMNGRAGDGDRVTVETWPTGTDRLFALREFRICDESGRSLGTAVTFWLILDATTRRPVRPQPYLDRIQPICQEPRLSGKSKKPPLVSTPGFTRDYPVRFRDVDINRHVNNVSYIEWILESLPDTFLKKHRPVALVLEYLDEAFHGDHIIAEGGPDPSRNNRFVHRLARAESNRELARAVTEWEKTA
jgi:medium-chain acyl-[acyl-carrier-protein] hydrolase